MLLFLALTRLISYGVFCQIDEKDMTKTTPSSTAIQRIATLESLCRRCLNFLDDDPGISDASFERLDQLIDDLRDALGMETWAEARQELKITLALDRIGGAVMDKIEAELLRAQSQTLAEKLEVVDRAVRDCIDWLAHADGVNVCKPGQHYFRYQNLELGIELMTYRSAVMVQVLVDDAYVLVYTAWRRYPYPIASPTIEVFKPGKWLDVLLPFAVECREELQALVQEQEQERLEQMADAFAPLDDWEGMGE